jgi:CBS domain containing-hemolysin-like protein
MSPLAAVLVSVAVIGLSAFFVAAEFALVAARRHRLAEAAARGPSGRAALRSAGELSLVLAGSQLGITLCTLALGAVTKPAVHDLLAPLASAAGLPAAVAEPASFAMALVVVTFLHLVVGEMAPKSWAIAHPERSAVLLAVPVRGFLWLTRPLLVALNGIADRCLRPFGVAPVDGMETGHGPDELRALVEHSTRSGTLDPARGRELAAALDHYRRRVGECALPLDRVLAVDAGAPPARIRSAARDGGHSRLVVLLCGQPVGVVHVRDALDTPPGSTAADLMRPIPLLDAGTEVHAALSGMRARREHLALVRAGGEPVGLVTLADLLPGPR